jgi:ankyrin repeat protein
MVMGKIVRDFQDAVRHGNVDKVTDLLDTNPEVIFETDEYIFTPLHIVASQGINSTPTHEKIAIMLIEAGADPNARSTLGWTPLHLIAINGSIESYPVARVLLENGADILAVANDGYSDWRYFWMHGSEIFNLLTSYMPKQ